jgi:hypothetical protein
MAAHSGFTKHLNGEHYTRPVCLITSRYYHSTQVLKESVHCVDAITLKLLPVVFPEPDEDNYPMLDWCFLYSEKQNVASIIHLTGLAFATYNE